jgi:histidinol dehydrogenase
MQCELITGEGDAQELAAQLRALIPPAASVAEAVSEIIANVRERRDAAVAEYTRRFDTPEPGPVVVEADELEDAASRLDPAMRTAIETAIHNVSEVARATVRGDIGVHFANHEITLRTSPVDRAAIYVPGGRAPYPSTVVMGVLTARVAGVPEVVVCSPPPVDDTVLAACALTEASAVYRMGGAQAIAALAYGTETISAVDVIAGPGNLYVQEAKRQVFGQVGIDSFAGPSDLVAIAHGNIDRQELALDLLAQAEHGPGTLVIAISTDAPLLTELQDLITSAPETGAIVRLIEVVRLDQALALAQALAPEHLQLVGPHAEGLAPEITKAGCLFVGQQSGTAFGDYIAGANHVLPTGGAARFASALSPEHFTRRFSEVRISDPTPLAHAALPLARAEGFEYHARSIEARIRDNHN